jgi:hypothetical protein
VLLLGLLGLAALRGRVVHALARLPVEDGPHRLLAGGKAGGDVEQLVGVNGRAAPELADEVSAGRALEEALHDLGLGHAWELRAALGEVPYEVPERLTGLLGARAQITGVSRAHVRALEVPHKGADQVVPVLNLAGRQVLEPRGACRGVLQARRERRLVLQVPEVLMEASANIGVKGERRENVPFVFVSVPPAARGLLLLL